eukprot:1028226-Prorocentrum_minimum.AAC.1
MSIESAFTTEGSMASRERSLGLLFQLSREFCDCETDMVRFMEGLASSALRFAPPGCQGPKGSSASSAPPK